MATGAAADDTVRVSASLLDSARVGDCMRAGIFSCDPDTPARELAAMMSSLRIHAVALRTRPPQAPAFISDLDLVASIAGAGDLPAHQLASRAAVTVSRAQTLREAANLMATHGATHLVVIDEASGHPVGVLATTDILQAYAGSAAIQDKE
jgi:CBS domain-containing protein